MIKLSNNAKYNHIVLGTIKGGPSPRQFRPRPKAPNFFIFIYLNLPFIKRPMSLYIYIYINIICCDK